MPKLFLSKSETIEVQPAKPVSAVVEVPGSKSLTNRYLLLAALAEGQSRIQSPLESDDTRFMRQALAQVGVKVSESEDGWRVEGRSRWHAPNEPIFVGNAGTVMRFFTPALVIGSLQGQITGNERMRARPIGDLVDGLRQSGVRVDYLEREAYPPLLLQGPMRSGRVRLRGDASSQYLSGLLMSLPLLKGDSQIEIEGPLVSRTYVEMTCANMAEFGVRVQADPQFRSFHIPGDQSYQPRVIRVEPDASTASYWFALPLMVGGQIQVRHVPETSTQGDFGLIDIFRRMGAQVRRTDEGLQIGAAPLQGVDVDMNSMSDVAPTLAVVATRASSPTWIRNVGNMRIKECDRIETIQRAFDQLGLKMESGPDWMKIYPGQPQQAAILNPEEDHRMAMIFALLGLAHGGVKILDPDCVAKTYPNFYCEMERVCMPKTDSGGNP